MMNEKELKAALRKIKRLEKKLDASVPESEQELAIIEEMEELSAMITAHHRSMDDNCRAPENVISLCDYRTKRKAG